MTIKLNIMSKILVADIMTKSVVTVDISQTVSDIIKIITEKNIRHIPVMENGKIIGMVSKSDYQRLTYNTYTTHEFHALPVVDNEQLIGIISTTDILRLFAQRL